MSVLDITQINTKTEQPAGRGSALASNDPSQKFDAVSHQEKQRLEQKRLEQDRLAEKRLARDRADQQAQERRAERQRIDAARAEKNRAAEKSDAHRQDADATSRKQAAPDSSKSYERNKPEHNKPEHAKPDHDKPEGADQATSRPDSAKKDEKPVHGHSDSKAADSDSDSDKTKTDQVAVDTSKEVIDQLPFLSLTMPVSQVPANIRNPSLTSAGTGINTGKDGSDLSQFFSKLVGELSGDGPGSQKIPGALTGGPGSDVPGGFLAKGAAADALKTGDFSSQLARFQGSSDNSSMPNNATSLQRGLEGRETLAPLKSYSTSVDLPVQHAEWGDKIAGKLAWLTTQRMSAAEIHITPPDMGPMHVRVQVHNDQAQVAVHAANHVVRDQLEQSGQRLRDMLQENGLNLDSFDVSSQTQSDNREGAMGDGDSAGSGGSGAGLAEGGEPETDVTARGTLDLSLRGEVDTYV